MEPMRSQTAPASSRFASSSSAFSLGGGPQTLSLLSKQSMGVDKAKSKANYAILGDACKVLSQHLLADGKQPELLDQIMDESERHNYFFEPYHSIYSAPIEERAVRPIPQALLDQYDELEVLSLMGLLPEINRAWLSIDNKLFLWNYENGGEDFTLYDGLDQVIVSVGLVKPKPNIFKDFVKYLLVVATPVEVIMLAMTFENDDVVGGDVRLRQTEFSIPSDNTNMQKIVGTPAGRIFMAGKDGSLHELVYDVEEGISSYLGLSRKCRKVNHSTSTLSFLLPTFIRNLNASSEESLVDLVIDNERQILYTLSYSGIVDVFDLGSRGRDLSKVASKNLFKEAIAYCAKYHQRPVNCPDAQLFDSKASPSHRISTLCVVPTSESAAIHVVAITTLGIRIYLTTQPGGSASFYITSAPPPPPASSGNGAFIPAGTNGNSSSSGSTFSGQLTRKPPITIDAVHIRLPPSSCDPPSSHDQREPYEGNTPGVVAGRSPSNTYVAYYGHGVALMADFVPMQADNLLGISRDVVNRTLGYQTSRKLAFREAVCPLTASGKIWALAEAPPAIHTARSAVESTSTPAKSQSVGPSIGTKRRYSSISDSSLTGGLEASYASQALNEFATQHFGGQRLFLSLTTKALHVYAKVRPIDYLYQVLVTRDHDQHQLEGFFRYFGIEQTCAMLFSLACGTPRDVFNRISSAPPALTLTPGGGVSPDKTPGRGASSGLDMQAYNSVRLRATRAIFEFGGTAGVSAYRPSAQGSSQVVMHDDIYLSDHHNGLCFFFSRLLRPLWFSTLAVPSSSTASAAKGKPLKTFTCKFQRDMLEELREPLWQLQQLMENTTPYSVAIHMDHTPREDLQKPSRGNVMTRVLTLHSQYEQLEKMKQENALKAEQKSIAALYRLLVRCVEGVSLLILACEHLERELIQGNTKAQEIFGDTALSKLTFADFVALPEGEEAARRMVDKLMDSASAEAGEIHSLSDLLRHQCPSFFSMGDMLQYKALELVNQAKATQSEHERNDLLEDSLSEFLKASQHWTTPGYLSVLRDICMEYRSLNYFRGVVDLCLRCAYHNAHGSVTEVPEASAALALNGSLPPANLSPEERSVLNRVQCYGCILDLLEELLEGNSKGGNLGPSARDAVRLPLRPEERDAAAKKTLDRALSSDDALFQEHLCSWLIEHGHEELLVRARSGFVEGYLRSKDPELLCSHYVYVQRYAEAARVEEYLAHREEPNLELNPNLPERIRHLTRAIQHAQNASSLAGVYDESGISAGDRLHALEEKLDVAKLQLEVLDELEKETEIRRQNNEFTGPEGERQLQERLTGIKTLTYLLLSVSKLYNKYASKYQMWGSCLSIMHCCNYDEPALIQKHCMRIILSHIPIRSSNKEIDAWLQQQHREGDGFSFIMSTFEDPTWIQSLRSRIVELGRKLYNTGADFAFPVKFLCAYLERFAFRYRTTASRPITGAGAASTEAWVARAMVEVGVPYVVLQEVYKALYYEQELDALQVHVLESWCVIVESWLKFAVSPRAPQLERITFSDMSPILVKDLDAFKTDLQAMGAVVIGKQDRSDRAAVDDKTKCLAQLRRLRTAVQQFREDVFS